MKPIYKQIRKTGKTFKKKLFEELWYSTDLITYGVTDITAGMIVQVICNLPKKVRSYIEDIPFYEVGNTEGLCATFFYRKGIGNEKENGVVLCPMILLNWDKTKSDIEKYTVIAHEIAHTYLNHFDTYKDQNLAGKKENQIEKDADDLIEKWGFNRAYKSYKIRKR